MIVDGRKLADEILVKLKKEIQKLPRLTIGAVLVGKNSASRPTAVGRGSPALRAAESFLKQKAKAAKILEISFKVFKFSQKTKTEKLLKEISKLNNSKTINGIVVQLPLPKQIDTNRILAAINPKKDIDALSKNPKVLAPTVESVKYIFDKYRVNYKNKNILIIGRGRLVGQPIYNWLNALNAQKSYRQSMRSEMKIQIIDVKQKNQLPKLAREADIIISGVGKTNLINGNIIKKGIILIDFGFSRKNKKISPFDKLRTDGERSRTISGDFDFNSCVKKAKFITPIPGGMGPIMVAMLFKNLIKLNKKLSA